MNAYNFSALSPCGRLPTGNAQIVEEEIVTPVPNSNDTHFVAVVTRWKNLAGEYATPGYVVHSAHSVYRVLIGCKMMMTEEFRYDIRNLEGLQSSLVMQAVVLSLSMARFFTFNDIGLRLWTGYDARSPLNSSFPLDNLIKELTYNTIIPADVMTYYENLKLEDDVRLYYGMGWDEQLWGNSYPIPFFVLLSWNMNYEKQYTTTF